MTAPSPAREGRRYVGRFAPSPTGPLHFGSLVAAVASWLDARAAGGAWRLRIEDVDAPRTVPAAADDICRTLEALGLDWDGEVMRQRDRTAAYEQALERLRRAGLTYACKCSRREVADSGIVGIEGAIYPGTCAGLHLAPGPGMSERFRTTHERIGFADRVQAAIGHDVSGEIGDFVLKRRDGLHAYQLAVVVDDAEQGITDIVRGADLLWSTPRQLALQRALGHATPRYLHVPVAANANGEKLSKQTLAPAIGHEAGSGALRAALAFLGQQDPGDGPPRELLARATAMWRPERIPKAIAIQATFGDRPGPVRSL